MEIVKTAEELRGRLGTAPRPLGFVPTMGALHEGHLALVRRARAECATVLMSIFVNPTQFGPNEDFARYPRDLGRDLGLAKAESVDVAFVPELQTIYPPGFTTFVEVERLTRRWEGESRPGHFRGVATVVTKLLNLAGADVAYFGQKDYQQLQVVRRLTADLAIPTRIVGCPTVREPDGLALSSRNVYLGPEDRRRATTLFRSLCRAQELLDADVAETAAIERAMADCFAEAGVRLDYAAVVDPATLEPIAAVQDEARVLVAGFVGGVHLIDNAPLVRRPTCYTYPTSNSDTMSGRNQTVTDGYARPELLAETAWLAEHLGDRNLRIVDLRYYFDGRDARAAYLGGHIPGAVYCHWPEDLADSTGQIKNLVPTAEQAARAFSRLGIGDDTLVVGYDDEGGHFAARLWWVLAYYGHDRLKILNGGIQKWQAEGRPLATDDVKPAPAVFTPRPPRQTMRVLAEELAGRLGDPALALADVRRRTEFVGAEARAARGGRIPGARHVFWQENLRPDWTFRSADEIRQRHLAAGVTPDKQIVTYCQGGVRAAHAMFALTLAGFPDVRMYDGSWAEWGNRADLPIETGE